jgi:hypothetical protein
MLGQLAVHFRHPLRTEKTIYQTSYYSYTVKDKKKLNSVCERMLVDSTEWVGQWIALILLFKKISPKTYGPHCVY